MECIIKDFDFSKYSFVGCQSEIKKDSRITFYSNNEIEIDGVIIGELLEINKEKGFIKYRKISDNKYLNNMVSWMQIILTPKD